MVPDKKLRVVEKKIKEACKECDGVGCLTCKRKTARIKMYAGANIPIDYWMLALKDFKGDQNFKRLLSEQLSDINKMYENGASFAFVGNLGTGKTYGACCILKTAVVMGFTSRYINMADIVEKTVRSEYEEIKSITNIDFLCIDEYDSRWVFPSEKAEQLFGQTMEKLLRERFQNRMPTIICSNTPNLTDVLAGDFARSTESLFAKYMEEVYVSGKDFRKIQK